MTQKQVIFICVYNNTKQMEEMLLPSLRRIGRTGKDDLLIDNTSHKYTSCAQAFNTELALHPGHADDVLIFLHQDMAFDDDAFLQRIVKELSDNPRQILGFAGMPKSGRTVSNLKYLRTKSYITRTQVKEKIEVESLDECCFAMTRGVYEQIRFDEEICDHWHLYAVNFCYEARLHHQIPSYVLPETIYHKMDGTFGLDVDKHFLRSLAKMRKKYHHEVSVIYTPCYIVPTNWLKFALKIAKTKIKSRHL
jgi:hypothetical protein